MHEAVRGVILRNLAHKEFIPTSEAYALVDLETAIRGNFPAWHNYSVVERQDAVYRDLIQQMYAGRARQDLAIAAEAVQKTELENPSLLEVGCGSGYYSEILRRLVRGSVRYVGLDYSQTMIHMARERYPERPFVVGDATALPFADGAFDIVLNGVSLMHVLRYQSAITESRRVARRWCIFHTVPLLKRRETTILIKRAYGQPTIEVIFNEAELQRRLERSNLTVRHVLDSIPYDLSALLGEPTVTKTYVCEVM